MSNNLSFLRPPITPPNPSMYNSPTTDDLLNGMRQRASNNSLSHFGGISSARSHPVNGIARISSNSGAAPTDPVPVRLTSTAELQRAIPGPSSSSTGNNRRKQQQQRQPSLSNKLAYEDQFMKHFENQMQPSAVGSVNKRKEGPSNVIEIPDDYYPPAMSRAGPKPDPKPPKPTHGNVVKNANIGIHYPPGTQTKGTPIYLPDLPEGTSINKIPKKPSKETTQPVKPNPATITAVTNKQTTQRPSSSSIPKQAAAGSSYKPGMQSIGNVSIIPTPPRTTSKPSPSVVRTAQQQQPAQSRVTNGAPTAVTKVVQQITQNSRGNTSITPVTRPSAIPTANLNQGWKRKEPPSTNAAYPAKMIRLNPNLQIPSRK